MAGKKEEGIKLKPLDIGELKLKVVGDSPYLPEPMDMAVLERYNQKKSHQNYTKDSIPEEEKVKAKFYTTSNGEYAMPSRAFYNSMIRASSYLVDKTDGGMRKVTEGVIVKGDMLPIQYENIEVLTHWGRTGGQSGSPRKVMRNAFNGWSVELVILYNKTLMSAEQIINVLNWAGFHIGVGGFRKEKKGNFGSFHIEFK